MDWRTGFGGGVIQQYWGRERSSFCGREGLYSWGKVWHLYSVGRKVAGGVGVMSWSAGVELGREREAGEGFTWLGFVVSLP